MAEIPQIQPVQVKDRFGNIPKQTPQGDPFSITGDVPEAVKSVGKNKGADAKNEAAQQQSRLLSELSKDILKPIQDRTNVQASQLRELITASKLLSYSSDKLSPDLFKKIFINPAELKQALMQNEKGQTAFSGTAFDVLRQLAKLDGGRDAMAAARSAALEAALLADEALSRTPETDAVKVNMGMDPPAVNGYGPNTINGSVINILKHFDCYANQDMSLKAVLAQLKELSGRLSAQDAEILQQYIDKLENMIDKSTGREDGRGLTSSPMAKLNEEMRGKDIFGIDRNDSIEARSFLKGELVPMLSRLVHKYQQADAVRNPVVSVVHHVARYDKADPLKLAGSIENLAETLKEATNLTDDNINELRNLLFDAAKSIRMEQKAAGMEKEFLAQFGVSDDKGDLISVLAKVIEDDAPARVQRLAMELLGSMLDNESPIMPLSHYMIPINYNGSETFLELYVDKDPQGAKGARGKEDSTVNIFFTIQSDDYGTFEVDLLARSGMIDLDISAPEDLQKEVKGAKERIRKGMEESGYRLAGYKVGVYRQSNAAVKQFPALKKQTQKMGVDIKV